MAVKRAPAFGLKEVADVKLYPAGGTFTTATITTEAPDGYTYVYSTGSETTSSDPMFIFDSLKVSNIEVSSEDASATGGQGNPELISWSYSKEITFTMEDALFSLSTLDLMFGANGEIDDSDTSVVVIDSDSFPANYAIVGKTYIRSQQDGKDEPFLFFIPNGKIQVNGTLTMEADGDPTTFEMQVKALKGNYGTGVTGSEKALVVFLKLTDNTGTGAKTHYSNNVVNA